MPSAITADSRNQGPRPPHLRPRGQFGASCIGPGGLRRAEHVVEIVRRLTVSEIAHFGVPPVRVDLLRSADGIDAEGAIMRAQRATLGDLTIPVLAIDDLIANKRAANRPQDLADVALLESVRKKST